MPEVTATVTIGTGPEPIWELMSDPSRYPEFVVATDRMVDVGRGEFGLGYEYVEYGGLKPFTGESTWRVTEFEPMRHQHHVGDDGKVTIDLDIDLVPSGESTELTLRIAVQPRWFVAPVMAAMWPAVMRRRAQDDMDRTAANVKRLIESAAG